VRPRPRLGLAAVLCGACLWPAPLPADEPGAQTHPVEQAAIVLGHIANNGSALEAAGKAAAATTSRAGATEAVRAVASGTWSSRRVMEGAAALRAESKVIDAVGKSGLTTALKGANIAISVGVPIVKGVSEARDQGWTDEGVAQGAVVALEAGASSLAQNVAVWGAVAVGTTVLSPLPPRQKCMGLICYAMTASLGYTIAEEKALEAWRAHRRAQEEAEARRRQSEPRPTSGTMDLAVVRVQVYAVGEAEPGGNAQFRATAELEARGGDAGLPPTRRSEDVTASATWTFSGGSFVAPGAAKVDCAAEGATVTATATLLGQSGSAAAGVRKLPLAALTVSAGRAEAKPGESVALAAEGTFANAFCTQRRSVPPGEVSWTVAGGGSAAGGTLTIGLDTESGTVTATGNAAGIASNAVAVTVIPPTLQQLIASGPVSVPVCGIVAFDAMGEYSNRPNEPRTISPDLVRWTFSGRHTRLGPASIRADWPSSVIIATVSGLGKIGQTSVSVQPLPHTSAWFPIEDISIATRVKVGEAVANRALEFSCDGPRVTGNVQWISETPDLLACSPGGECQGLAPGRASIKLIYQGEVKTSRYVEVYADDAEAAPECRVDDDCPRGQVCNAEGTCVARRADASPQVPAEVFPSGDEALALFGSRATDRARAVGSRISSGTAPSGFTGDTLQRDMARRIGEAAAMKPGRTGGGTAPPPDCQSDVECPIGHSCVDRACVAAPPAGGLGAPAAVGAGVTGAGTAAGGAPATPPRPSVPQPTAPTTVAPPATGGGVAGPATMAGDFALACEFQEVKKPDVTYVGFRGQISGTFEMTIGSTGAVSGSVTQIDDKWQLPLSGRVDSAGRLNATTSGQIVLVFTGSVGGAPKASGAGTVTWPGASAQEQPGSCTPGSWRSR